VVIVIHNAWRLTRGTELGRELAEIERDAEAAYGGEKPSPRLSAEPEVLIFGGSGEWVSAAFIEQAREAGRRVARLLVPRFFGERRSGDVGVGTAWLAAPRLVFTNHHVVEARDDQEPPASADEFRRQGESILAWFDYHREGQRALEVTVAEVVSSDRTLDYALLRLAAEPPLADRRQMALRQGGPALSRGTRLNIVQCPGGGPLTFAIRNNFYVGPGQQAYHLRYLTDTREGSSGSPVLDDTWQVVAMHHGFQQVKAQRQPGEAGLSQVAKFHNEGTTLEEILAHLPAAPRDEIRRAQGWA
jgi:endonuclease G, mitochondrial